MRKILLVIDNYKEMIALESILRRLGFDVLSLAKDVLVKDALLRFHPEVVIATYNGRSVDGMRLASRMVKLTPAPRVALMHKAAQLIDMSGGAKSWIDAMIEAPVVPRKVIQMVAQLTSIDPAPLIKKYEKLVGTTAGLPQLDEPVRAEEPQTVDATEVKKSSWDPQTDAGTATTARTVRSDRYEKFLSEHNEAVDRVLPQEAAKAAMKKLAEASESEREELAKIDAEKRAFVKAMFEKKENHNPKKR